MMKSQLILEGFEWSTPHPYVCVCFVLCVITPPATGGVLVAAALHAKFAHNSLLSLSSLADDCKIV